MSFVGYKKTIDYGDTVIIYIGFENMLQFEVTKNRTDQSKFGVIRHDNLIGLEFGCKITTANGYYHVLHPTPELWTVNLPHRTQILYATDISVITLQLDLQPGSKVIESGTGSGSLSHSIARSIAPNGHLYTFDFHEKRVEIAQDEFRRHGLSDLVTSAKRDVCKDGFGLGSNVADAVFLDLPSPWEVVLHAKESLRPGGRLCSFSPCIEQVQRTCVALQENGFVSLTTLECLLRPIDVRTTILPVTDLGFKNDGTQNSSSEIVEFSNWDLGQGKPMTGHIELNSAPAKAQSERDKAKHLKQKNDKRRAKQNAKRSRDEVKVSLDDNDDSKNCDDDDNENTDKSSDNEELGDKKAGNSFNKVDSSYVCRTGFPVQQLTGHTGFLTFATLYPD